MCTFLNFLNFFILHFSELCSNFTAILGFWQIVDFFICHLSCLTEINFRKYRFYI